jgi:hypothetical protein
MGDLDQNGMKSGEDQAIHSLVSYELYRQIGSGLDQQRITQP